MKKVVRFKDSEGNVEVKEVYIPDKEFLESKIKYPHKIEKSKKAYSRKKKHKRKSF
jgi:hypothetical protein